MMVLHHYLYSRSARSRRSSIEPSGCRPPSLA
jgi:hypothetical protein